MECVPCPPQTNPRRGNKIRPNSLRSWWLFSAQGRSYVEHGVCATLSMCLPDVQNHWEAAGNEVEVDCTLEVEDLLEYLEELEMPISTTSNAESPPPDSSSMLCPPLRTKGQQDAGDVRLHQKNQQRDALANIPSVQTDTQRAILVQQ